MRKLLRIKRNGAGYCVLGCSVKGKEKRVNQDSILFEANEDGTLCLLADGLGSAVNAEFGSRAVCEAARSIILTEGVTEEFPEVLKKRWADALPARPLSCDTTFRFLWVTGAEIVYGGIGDGWTMGIADGKYFEDRSIGSFSNQTDSMLSAGYGKRFKIVRMPYETLQVLSLATDGFSEDIDEDRTEKFIRDCHAEIKKDPDGFLLEMEGMMKNWPIQTSRDDKSIIILGNTNE